VDGTESRLNDGWTAARRIISLYGCWLRSLVRRQQRVINRASIGAFLITSVNSTPSDRRHCPSSSSLPSPPDYPFPFLSTVTQCTIHKNSLIGSPSHCASGKDEKEGLCQQETLKSTLESYCQQPHRRLFCQELGNRRRFMIRAIDTTSRHVLTTCSFSTV